jgi:predicted nucleotidyltransferase component of viral defense system
MGKTILTPLQKKALLYLSKDPIIQKQFIFTGGTALSEYYLHHRLSEDLDFFSDQDIDPLWIQTIGQKLSKTLEAKTVDIEQSFNRNLVFFTFPDSILKTEFTYFPFSSIEKPKTQQGIRIDSLIDIAVNKFFTIYQKPASRHFIDLYKILSISLFTWEELSKFARIKFDTVIDPIQLGSQLMTVQTVKDYPTLITHLPKQTWQAFFLSKAKELKTMIQS